MTGFRVFSAVFNRDLNFFTKRRIIIFVRPLNKSNDNVSLPHRERRLFYDIYA